MMHFRVNEGSAPDTCQLQIRPHLPNLMKPNNGKNEKKTILIVKILDYCLHLYCYVHNVPADMSSGFFHVYVEPGNLHGTWNYVLY